MSTRVVNKRSNSEVYDTIKDAIQYLEWMPGSVIHENELVERLGCSRTPIREALIRLSGEFLVDIYPQRGTYVANIDFHLAHEVAYMRHILDTDVCMSLCSQRAQIRGTVEEKLYFMSTAVKNQDVARYIRMDNEFHRAIFTVAGHEMIWSIIANSRAHYNRVLVLDLSRSGILQKSYQEHLDIVQCIEDGDAQRLQAILDVHHDHQGHTEWEAAIRAQFPQYFSR